MEATIAGVVISQTYLMEYTNVAAGVAAIPTNPLLSGDSRLPTSGKTAGAAGGLLLSDANNKAPETPNTSTNLNAPVGSIPTTPLLSGDARLPATGKTAGAAGGLMLSDSNNQAPETPSTSKLSFDLVSGVNYLKTTLYGFMGTLLDGSASLIKAAWQKLFNIATPTNTVNDLAVKALQPANQPTVDSDGKTVAKLAVSDISGSAVPLPASGSMPKTAKTNSLPASPASTGDVTGPAARARRPQRQNRSLRQCQVSKTLPTP